MKPIVRVAVGLGLLGVLFAVVPFWVNAIVGISVETGMACFVTAVALWFAACACAIAADEL